MLKIFQIKKELLREKGFISYEFMTDLFYKINPEDYDMVYETMVSDRQINRKDGEYLSYVFTKFNVDRPEDFKGHSLSVSDVVMIDIEGESKYFYVDYFGFRDITEKWIKQ